MLYIFETKMMCSLLSCMNHTIWCSMHRIIKSKGGFPIDCKPCKCCDFVINSVLAQFA